MTRLSVALIAAGCLATPGLAFADMSCAEFNGMDMDSQMQIVGAMAEAGEGGMDQSNTCLLYTSPSPRDISGSRMPSSA